MIKFSKEKVLLLHQLIIAETGGTNEVRDFGLLESALEGAYATFDGKDLYPAKQEKAARLYPYLQSCFCGRQQANRNVCYAHVPGG